MNSEIVAYTDITQLSNKQMNILKELKKGEKKQSELYVELNIPKSTLSEAIDPLEKSGLVTAKKFGREKVVELTTHGKKQLKNTNIEDKKVFLAFL